MGVDTRILFKCVSHKRRKIFQLFWIIPVLGTQIASGSVVLNALGRWRAIYLLHFLAISLGLSWASSTSAASQDFVTFNRLTPSLEYKSILLGRRLNLVFSRHQLSQNRAQEACRSGERPACRVEKWQRFLGETTGRTEADQLRLVNRYVNRARYISDRRNWKRADYWAVPEELFSRGGDCEDYAIAKYLSLRSLGISPERLRIVILYDRRRREDHAILAVFGDEEILILDNHYRRVMSWTNLRTRYQPYYSLNERSVWIHQSGR